MRKFSQINEGKLNLAETTVNYLSAAELKQYLAKEKKNFYETVSADIAKHSDRQYKKTFHPAEASEFIINYLIKHNADYVQDLGKGTQGNALAAFFSRSLPTDPEKKHLYQSIGELNASGRLKEVPVFMTQSEYDDLMSNKCTLDYIVYDMESERGRNELAKQYESLCYMFAHKYAKSANHNFDDWVGTANMALVDAMNDYAKTKGLVKSSKKKGQTDFDADAIDDNELKKDVEKQSKGDYEVKFITYASWRIRFWMLAMAEDSHLVRIPKSAQIKMRRDQGKNIYNNTTSVDQKMSFGSSKDEGNSKTLGDTLGTPGDVGDNLNREDADKLFNSLYNLLSKKLKKEDYAIFLTHDGLKNMHKIGNSEWSDILTTIKPEAVNELVDAIVSEDADAEQDWLEKFKNGEQPKRFDKPKGTGKSSISIKYGNIIKMLRSDKRLFDAMREIREDHEEAVNMKDRTNSFDDVFDTKNLF